MENLIFGAFATLDGYREGDSANLGRAAYDRCTVVALCSAKAQNPGCTVALVTNAPPPQPFLGQLKEAGVEVWDCPFTAYRVPAETNWALAYYKLCAMDWVLANRDFARAAMIDLDTYTQYPLDDLWREAGEAVLFYQVPHAAGQGMAQAISRIYDAVCPEGAPHVLTHFGGELVAGSKPRLQALMGPCRRYFPQLPQAGFPPRAGEAAVWGGGWVSGAWVGGLWARGRCWGRGGGGCRGWAGAWGGRAANPGCRPLWRTAAAISRRCSRQASHPGKGTKPSGAAPPTAACWPGSRCGPPTPIFSATGWAGGSILYPPTTCWTRCASCTCPAQPRSGSSSCSTAATAAKGCSRRLRGCTACAACLPPARRCWRRCACGCWHACRTRPQEETMAKRNAKDLTQRLETVIKNLIPQRGQNADELGPMMRAIKAVHSVTGSTSTLPEDLERQRAAQELFGRLVTPAFGIRSDGLTVGGIPAEWVSLEHGHDRRHAVLYCHCLLYTSPSPRDCS